MSAVKINKVFGETPVNVVLFKNDKSEITKMEINGKKFGSQKMGTAFMSHELKLTEEQVAEVLTAEGEPYEAPAGNGAAQKETLKEGEEVTRVKAFRTSKTVIEVTFVEGLKAGKKTFKATVKDLVKVGDAARAFIDKAGLATYLGTAYGIAKTTVDKMVKVDTSLAMTAEAYSEVKSKIEANEELEDVGILKTAGGASKTDKEPKAPREKQKPLAGYPSWVVRDPQDTIQYAYSQEARENGYSAKSNEAYRSSNGEVKVGFAEGTWVVIINLNEEYAKGEVAQAAVARLEELKKGDITKNQADRSAEKRCAVFLAKAIAGKYKLAFNESSDVEKVDPKVLGSKERRTTIYKR